MLEQIGQYLYKRAIGRYRSTNLHKIDDGHFENLKTVGVIFDASRTQEHKTVLRLRKDLQERDKEVQLLGYFPSKDAVDHQPFSYFTDEHINFARLPKSDIVKQFIARPFDVLINLDPVGHKPIDYICAASRALFKIGPATANPAHFDLMIDQGDTFNLKQYIDQVRSTFSQIN